MRDFKIMWEVLSSAAEAIFNFIVHWVKFTMDCHISPSIPLIVMYFLIIAFILGSGFLAATVAEKKEKNRFLHFIAGICFPYFYPAAIYYFIPAPNVDYKPAKDVELEKRELESKRLTESLNEKIANDPFAAMLKPKTTEAPPEQLETPPQAPALPPVETANTQNNSDGSQKFNQDYFKGIATDENGGFNGPFMIDFNDGRIVEASKILNAMPEGIEIEMIGDGDNIRKIRVPYSKISGCVLKSNWMDNSQENP